MKRSCVYDPRIVPFLRKYSRSTYAGILKAQKLHPGVHFGPMISMLAHLAATVATNAAQGKPLKRRWIKK